MANISKIGNLTHSEELQLKLAIAKEMEFIASATGAVNIYTFQFRNIIIDVETDAHKNFQRIMDITIEK